MKTNKTYNVNLTETPEGSVVVNSVEQLVEVLGKSKKKYKPVDKRKFTSQHLNTVTKFAIK